MLPAPRQPLTIASQRGDRVVVLGCGPCDVTAELHTSDGLFALSVQAFFGQHARCTSLDLP